MFFALENRDLAGYRAIRTAGKELQTKIVKAAPKSLNLLRVAKAMSLPVAGKTLLFDSEIEMAAFFSFFSHEFLTDGKSLVDTIDPLPWNLSATELDVLEALRKSRTSLFKVADVMPDSSQIKLVDLIEPDRDEIVLTDIQFSKSLQYIRPWPIVFTRILGLSELNMTGGFFFPFDSQHATGLLQAYRQKTKKIAPADLPRERFVFFFRKHRQIGAAAALDSQ